MSRNKNQHHFYAGVKTKACRVIEQLMLRNQFYPR